MGVRLNQLQQAGRRDSRHWFHAHWPHIDTEKWPGTELEWAYCHPILTLLILVSPIAGPLLVRFGVL